LPSDSLENVLNPRASSHGLAGAEPTKLALNALTSNQKDNCNAKGISGHRRTLFYNVRSANVRFGARRALANT
jgi:hypothetical protein